jgi:hypothetical protein
MTVQFMWPFLLPVVSVYAAAHKEGRFISVHHLPQACAFSRKFATSNRVFHVILTSC